ncbi:kinin [Plakobranchus ocellatus]|uniref:Kinin n=1 Tax=Plakobranchus ocellatus TaxID=259542 RepID=A0AAV3YZH8_9GAST|nr:kinin [Plakobranchus ocellatus]
MGSPRISRRNKLRSSTVCLSWVRAPPTAPWPDRWPESLRYFACSFIFINLRFRLNTFSCPSSSNHPYTPTMSVISAALAVAVLVTVCAAAEDTLEHVAGAEGIQEGSQLTQSHPSSFLQVLNKRRARRSSPLGIDDVPLGDDSLHSFDSEFPDSVQTYRSALLNSKLPSERKRATFFPWAGKKRSEESSQLWLGHDFDGIENYFDEAGSSFGDDPSAITRAKRTPSHPWSGWKRGKPNATKRVPFHPWAGRKRGDPKSASFHPWAGRKRDESKRASFHPWAGRKRAQPRTASFHPWAGK